MEKAMAVVATVAAAAKAAVTEVEMVEASVRVAVARAMEVVLGMARVAEGRAATPPALWPSWLPSPRARDAVPRANGCVGPPALRSASGSSCFAHQSSKHPLSSAR